MPRSYSADLRERVIAACEAGLSRAEAARRSQLGERTVQSRLHLARVEGRRRAKAHAGGRMATITGTEDVSRRLVSGRNDATLAEQVAADRPRTGRTLSPSSRCRALQRLGLRRKKEDAARRRAGSP